jgi:hypothetical protein
MPTNIQSEQKNAALLRTRSNGTLRIAMALGFAACAMLLRFAPLPENFACFGALSLFCGFVLTGVARWTIPLVSFFVADCAGHFLGGPEMSFYHVPSMILNYVGFAAMVSVGFLVSRWLKNSEDGMLPWAGMVGTSLVGSTAFFLLSNLGAWLDPRMGYQLSLNELGRCYLMGLPFFQTTLISDVLFCAGFYGLYRLVNNRVGASAKSVRA